jgi:hypothetical protein
MNVLQRRSSAIQVISVVAAGPLALEVGGIAATLPVIDPLQLIGTTIPYTLSSKSFMFSNI